MPDGTAITILLADDDEDDRLMTRDALRDARLHNDLRTVVDGVERRKGAEGSAFWIDIARLEPAKGSWRRKKS